MKVLMITTEWPTPERPFDVPFLVRQVELLRKNDIDVTVFHFRGNKNPLNYLKACFAISKLIRQHNFDILNAQWGQSALPVLFSRKPILTTFRGSDLFGITDSKGNYTLAGKILTAASKLVAWRSTGIIIVTSRMVSKLPKDRSFFVLPSGIDLSLFVPGPKIEARKKLGIPENKKVVFFGGDPDRTDKRFSLAKKAVGLLQNNFSIELIFAKNVKRREMPLYYQAADVLLLTSKHEGSPNVVKEALACNLPVVSADVGDVKEQLQHVPGSYVCDNDDPVTIADCLKKVFGYSGEDRDIRRFVLDLDEHFITGKLIDIYKKTIAAHAS